MSLIHGAICCDMDKNKTFECYVNRRMWPLISDVSDVQRSLRIALFASFSGIDNFNDVVNLQKCSICHASADTIYIYYSIFLNLNDFKQQLKNQIYHNITGTGSYLCCCCCSYKTGRHLILLDIV